MSHTGHLELRVSCPDGFTTDTRLVWLAGGGSDDHAAALRGALEVVLRDLRRERVRWVVFDLSAMSDDAPVHALIRHFVPTAGSGRMVLLAGASHAFRRDVHARRTGQAEVQAFDTTADALAWLRRAHPDSAGGQPPVKVTADMVAALRRRTGAAIMTCRDALEHSNGNLDLAESWVLAHGYAAPKKHSGYGHAIPVTLPMEIPAASIDSDEPFTAGKIVVLDPEPIGAPMGGMLGASEMDLGGLVAIGGRGGGGGGIPGGAGMGGMGAGSGAGRVARSSSASHAPPEPEERARGITISTPANEVNDRLKSYDEARRLEPPPPPPPPPQPGSGQIMPPMVEPTPMPQQAMRDMEVAAMPATHSRKRGFKISLPSIPLPSLPDLSRGKKKSKLAASGKVSDKRERADEAPPKPKPAPANARSVIAHGRPRMTDGDTDKEIALDGLLQADLHVDDDITTGANTAPKLDLDLDQALGDLGLASAGSNMELVEVIRRMATVRYFSQMNPGRVFPLSVKFTKEKLQEWHTKAVSQVTGDEAIAVRADDPFLTVRPNFPGCHVSPAELTIDISAEETSAVFSVSPYAEGHMTDACVEMVYHDEIVQTIRTPMRIATQRLARMAATMSFLSPAYFMGLQAAGLDMTTQAKQGFPLLASVSSAVGGLTNLGLICGAVMLIAAGVFFWMKKPKASDPLYIFYNGPGG
ncbi:MAG: hypothetical protein AB7K09_05050 [Planctomycetota bacterium]